MTSRFHSLRVRLIATLVPLAAAWPVFAQAPAYPQVYPNVTGYPAIAADDPVSALSRYLRMLAANPRDLSSLTGAGRAALAVGDANAALGFYARAEEIAPRNGRIKAGLASALVQMEQPRTALRLFDEAVALGVPVSEIAADRGLARDLNGEGRLAQADYTLALRTKDDPETLRRLALSMAISGDRAGALTMLDPLMRKRDSGAYRARAFILALTGDQPGAAAAARAAMPGPQGNAMGAFMSRLAGLNPAQKALAVNFGYFPSDGRTHSAAELFADARARGLPAPAVVTQRAADAPLIPAGAVLGSVAAPVATANTAPRRRPGEAEDFAADIAPPAHVLRAPVPGYTQRAAAAGAATAAAPLTARAAAPVVQPLRTSALPAAIVPSGSVKPAPTGGTTAIASVAAPQRMAPVTVTGGVAGVPVVSGGVVASAAAVAPATAIVSLGAAPSPQTVPGLPPATASGVAASVVARPAAAPAYASGGAVADSARGYVAPSGRPASVAGTTGARIVPGTPSVTVTATGPAVATTAGRALPPVRETKAAPIRLAAATPMATVTPATTRAAPVHSVTKADGRRRAAVPAEQPDETGEPIETKSTTRTGRRGDARGTERAGKRGDKLVVADAAARDLPQKVGRGRGAAASDKKAAAEADVAEDGTAKPGKAKGIAVARQRDGKDKGDASTGARKAKDDPDAAAKPRTAKDKADAKAGVKTQSADKGKTTKADKAAAKPKVPERYWVQVASGSNKANLDKAWSTVKGKAPKLLDGKATYTAPWHASNRLLVGPFKTAEEAQAQVNKLAGRGVSGIQFTTREGVDVEKVDGR